MGPRVLQSWGGSFLVVCTCFSYSTRNGPLLSAFSPGCSLASPLNLMHIAWRAAPATLTWTGLLPSRFWLSGFSRNARRASPCSQKGRCAGEAATRPRQHTSLFASDLLAGRKKIRYKGQFGTTEKPWSEGSQKAPIRLYTANLSAH